MTRCEMWPAQRVVLGITGVWRIFENRLMAAVRQVYDEPCLKSIDLGSIQDRSQAEPLQDLGTGGVVAGRAPPLLKSFRTSCSGGSGGAAPGETVAGIFDLRGDSTALANVWNCSRR